MVLIVDGYAVAFVLVVLVVVSSAVIPLFFRNDARGELVKPFELSDEERRVLEARTLELKKQAQLSRKLRRRGARSATKKGS
jgi:hypothetical protein